MRGSVPVPGEESWIFLIDSISESVIQRKLRMPGRGSLSHLFLTDWEFCLGGHPELLPASQETRCVFHSLDCADKSIVYALESAVIQWSRQVQLVLKRESSQPLRQGESPTPKAELDFWKSRWVAGSRHPRAGQAAQGFLGTGRYTLFRSFDSLPSFLEPLSVF